MTPQRALIEAAELARTYVYTMHMNLAGVMGHENTIIRPDLERIDAAISSAKAAEEADGSLKAAERDTLLNWYKDRAERAESKLRGLEAKTAGSSEVREKEGL